MLSSPPRSNYHVGLFKCLKIAPCKGIVENKTADSGTMPSPFVRSTPSFLYNKDSFVKKGSTRATECCCVQDTLSHLGPATRART